MRSYPNVGLGSWVIEIETKPMVYLEVINIRSQSLTIIW